MNKKYGPSKSWGQLGQEHKEVLSEAKGWNNFRRTIATRYFTDPRYSEEDIQIAYKFLSSHEVRMDETDFLEGNPVHITVDGKILTQDLLSSSAELHSMEQHINFANVKTFVEIGGGYGRMAILLLQRYPHIQYTIVDVPPAIDVSRKFLQGKFDVKFSPPEALEHIENVDVYYTSSVLSELDFDKVNYYFDRIGKTAKYFYLKDWKKGHHLNSLPVVKGFILRLENKLSRMVRGKDSKKVQEMFDRYRISEDTFPSHGWKELLHQDCETATGYSPSFHKGKRLSFFEVIYQIR
jgi:hypothetical protein